MKLAKTYHDGDPILFDDRDPTEQRLLMLIGGISGNYKTEYMGIEKAMSIRLTATTYPKVKALSNLSGNSMNLVINDLIEVACGVMLDNMSERDIAIFVNEQSTVYNEWTEGYRSENKESK